MTAVSFGFPPPGFLGPSHATIGTFDGIHRGHLALLKPLIAGARQAGAASVLVTFEPHPRCVLDPDHCPANLTTLDEKAWLLNQLGLDRLVVIPFTPQVAGLSPAVFIKRLTRGMELRHLIIGEDFRFGQGRRGDPGLLRRLGVRQSFTVAVAPTLARGRTPISSSRIRRLVLLGQVRAAAQLLGRDYCIRSSVEHGARRGRELGFPTANLRIAPNKLLPATGIYAVRVEIDDRSYSGALSVGFRPTFGGNTLTVEVFILDFDGDLYDKLLTVWFVQRLRGEKRFASVPALQQQMARDVDNARRILGIPPAAATR
ncbi:MAG TPA: bifunctional riboflavin kinase/FAD synthetase [Candidatus Dormibacteraeota bacterium]|nr:bifunctional riboflavin kinase/FAD synthetase [Candidatus Dormibacteraeota bacterium]